MFFMLRRWGAGGSAICAPTNDDEFSLAAPADYNRAIKREMPLREAREQCGGPRGIIAGCRGRLQRVICISRRGCHGRSASADARWINKAMLGTPTAPQQLAEVFIAPAGASR
ncbi:hypothetical protein M8494_21610 [Serratia ureilytica]